jgi:N-acetylglucosaminyldiphosphoundecaprenol N-acetyl-beta-D-mannosaminyltransferase
MRGGSPVGASSWRCCFASECMNMDSRKIVFGKRNVLGVLVDACTYESATSEVILAAREGRCLGVTALAVHGLMVGRRDPVQRYRLNQLDLVVPDGQPVRWALNLCHSAGLRNRVYGPTLMLWLCRAAADLAFPVYLYGSTSVVVEELARKLQLRFPLLRIAGAEPSQFRPITRSEKEELIQRIRASGARLTFVGLGCPRQEVFVYESRHALEMPVISVGAAFDYHSGFMREPPRWVQRSGLQWAHRLIQEPRRLWKRYLLLNTGFLILLGCQLSGFWHPDPSDAEAPVGDLLLG